jgi:hypothetical protein
MKGAVRAVFCGLLFLPDGSEPWWFEDNKKIMTKLLKSGPRFTDFFMCPL